MIKIIQKETYEYEKSKLALLQGVAAFNAFPCCMAHLLMRQKGTTYNYVWLQTLIPWIFVQSVHFYNDVTTNLVDGLFEKTINTVT